MTDELDNLEKELRALEPRGLSKAGRRKLDAALFRPASRIRVLQIAVPVAVANPSRAVRRVAILS